VKPQGIENTPLNAKEELDQKEEHKKHTDNSPPSRLHKLAGILFLSASLGCLLGCPS